VQNFHPSFLGIRIYSIINTINTININYLYVNIGANHRYDTNNKKHIYINTRSLRAAKNIVSKYKTAAKQELEDQLLNWEDDMIKVEIDDDDDLI
jgi:hypothetical protein